MRQESPTRRLSSRRVRTNSSRAASGQIATSCAPGSPTEEIARMLEIEPQNRQPEPGEPEGNREGSGLDSGQRRGLLRRTRRSGTKPAEPPEFRSGAPGSAQDAAESRSGATASRATGPVPAVPVVPAGDSHTHQASTASQPVPLASFQAPVLVFQPPDLTDRRQAEGSRSKPESAPA